MTSIQAVLSPSSTLPAFDSVVKMEDRKRSLVNDAGDTDVAPSRKRLLKDENGQQMRMDAEKEKEIENYQKDAILRQMRTYKREKKDLEEEVQELQKKTQNHDERMRDLDSWFAQTLKEMRQMIREKLPTPPPSADNPTGETINRSALLFENHERVSKHLAAHTEEIKGFIDDLYSRFPVPSLDIQQKDKQINELLANETVHFSEMGRMKDTQESLSARLEKASYRYMTAEKKLERAKSTQVLKLERAAMGGSSVDTSSPTTSKKAVSPTQPHPEVNGELENGIPSAEAENARKEAIAAAEKNKSQLEEVEGENERLTNELSAARTKLITLTDDDYAESALFKILRSQYEDHVKKINDLEATNAHLREETQKLQSERTSYRSAVDDEHRTNNTEIEAQLARAENDLVRIRNMRDELQAELTIRKAAEDTRRTSADQSKELAVARDSRIATLESEVERYKLQLGESAPSSQTNLDDLDLETLKNKLRTLESQYALLNNELPSMEAAWRKTQSLATKKVEEIATWEERIAQLSAEKAKADQKYFATMKLKDMQVAELRTLKTQNARSSEIVTQLKDTEGKTRELVASLERQLVERMEALTKVEKEQRASESKIRDLGVAAEGLRKQVEDMKAMVTTKDRDVLAHGKRRREAEEDLEKCKIRLEDTRKTCETLKKNRAGVDGAADPDNWRKLTICPVCNTNIRNCVIKVCGHVFCMSCVDGLIANRSRKCPTCGRSFGSGDSLGITLT